MALFNGKQFNAEVFGKYVSTVEKVKQNAFTKAGIFNVRNDLKTMLSEQTGGNFVSVPMVGLIGGEPQNYDGSTDIQTSGIGSYLQSMIVYGRAKGWKEKDFTQDITGHDFMAEIAKQVAGYWDDVQQNVILSILKGIFSMSATKDAGFVSAHTYDAGDAVDATSLNNAIQKASGANKSIFTLAIMHSQIATNLENLQLLSYVKGVDANGIQREMSIATWNGRTVMIDDDVPFDEDTGVYTTYVLGRNAFDYCDIGAKTPYETTRDPLKNGGEDILVTRERKLLAPRGISFVQPSSPIVSPTNTQFETAARWALVKDNEGEPINHKTIPIARITSKA